MNQLTVQEKSIIENLPAGLKPYILLKQEPPIKNVAPTVVKKACLDAVTLAHFDSGTTLPDGDTSATKILEFQTEALFNELKGRFLELTISEMKEAVKMGVRNEFGQYFGLCAKSYHQFLKGFMDHPTRLRANMEYTQAIIKDYTTDKPKVFTPEYYKRAAFEAWEGYKKGEGLPMVAHAIYSLICEYKGVKSLYLPEEKEQILKEAQESYKAAFSGLQHQRNMNLAEKLVCDLSNISYVFHCRKVGLKYYFNRLIKEGKELEL